MPKAAPSGFPNQIQVYFGFRVLGLQGFHGVFIGFRAFRVYRV